MALDLEKVSVVEFYLVEENSGVVWRGMNWECELRLEGRKEIRQVLREGNT